MSRALDREQADVIATRFRTDGGRLQRRLGNWYVGGTMLFNYSCNNRLDSILHGSEAELLSARA